MAPPIEVYDKANRKVRAKMLVDAAGRHVRDPMTGAPLIVDEDFDINHAIAFGRALANIPEMGDGAIVKRAEIYRALYDAFIPSGPLDMQRSYNGMVGGGGDRFVGAFRPAASYLLGVFGRDRLLASRADRSAHASGSVESPLNTAVWATSAAPRPVII